MKNSKAAVNRQFDEAEMEIRIYAIRANEYAMTPNPVNLRATLEKLRARRYKPNQSENPNVRIYKKSVVESMMPGNYFII